MALYLVKDWGDAWEDEERDERGRWTSGGESSTPEQAPIEAAEKNISGSAQAFHDAGGTIETITPDESRGVEQELNGLYRGLVSANGGNEPDDRIASGFRLATVAAGSGRAIAAATVRVARDSNGNIAAVCSSTPRPVLDPDRLELGLMGSTGITEGAGSALTQEVMKEAAASGIPVVLEALDEDAEHFWRGQLGAGIATQTPGVPGVGLGWTSAQAKQLAEAA